MLNGGIKSFGRRILSQGKIPRNAKSRRPSRPPIKGKEFRNSRRLALRGSLHPILFGVLFHTIYLLGAL
jgi:hypothetical protein